MNNWYFDRRWIGAHGIGRFAGEIFRRGKFVSLPMNGAPSAPWEPMRFWRAMAKLPQDAAVFTPGYNAPLFVIRRFALTLHDLNHIDRSENGGVFKRLYYRVVIKRACRRAVRILTVSEFSRRRIIAWSGVDASRVVCVGNGVSECFSTEVAPREIGAPYLLCVGNRRAHKNERRVVSAFAKAAIDLQFKLVFTGEASPALLEQCTKDGVQGRVEFLGHLSEEELAATYRGATALLFPSLYEGFGLPVVEAMACGTPVLTSNVTALPEVAGEAALLVDPMSETEIAAGIARLCGDSELRDELRARGLRRATQFSWDRVGENVSAALAEK